jgi:UDP-N-acetylmuramoyl-L-alanyl-D-glutamate--2,6-diaminopimelate ligase
MKVLKDLLYRAGIVDLMGSTGIDISLVCFDSRRVTRSSLFVAVRGTQTDGHDFIAKAESMGAAAIVCEELPEKPTPGITYVKVQDSSVALAHIAANYYDNPSSKLRLVGITGTNGKTTTATLCYRLFRSMGYSAGLLSTVKNQINDQVIPSTHTTPDALQLNALLAAMVEEGCTHCFMEVSSHAVVQHRITGITFAGGVFTNITHDHLDYHKTFDAYIKAKKQFFDNLGSESFALVNLDDRNAEVMLQNTKAHKWSFSQKSMSDFKCRILENNFGGLLLNVDGNEVLCRLIGSFNAYNLLAVYGIAVLLGEEKFRVLTELSKLGSVEGRFDYITSEKGVTGIVDYAHTPDALENVLGTINDIRGGSGKVITVVGCGGDRDAHKRPVMAKIACENSDRVILTSDNPRSEDPAEILLQMEKGVSPAYAHKTLSITDRREAIKTACAFAERGDIILVAGKGHENYQEIKGVKHPFDDKLLLKELFETMSK